MQVLLASNDEKRSAHLTRLVKQLERDQGRGQTTIPESMFARLKEIQPLFRIKKQRTSGDSGRKIMAIRKRNETVRHLSYLVRDAYIMAKRKFDRGMLGQDVLNQHHIPKVAARENERDAGIWIERAHFLIDGDKAYSQHHPTLLRDPTRSELQAVLTAAEAAQQEANDAIDSFSTNQEDLRTLRKELDQLFTKARYALVGTYYKLSGSYLRECLYAYGYRFRRNKPAAAETVTMPEAETTTEREEPTDQPPRTLTRPETAFTYDAPSVVQPVQKQAPEMKPPVAQPETLKPTVPDPHTPPEPQTAHDATEPRDSVSSEPQTEATSPMTTKEPSPPTTSPSRVTEEPEMPQETATGTERLTEAANPETAYQDPDLLAAISIEEEKPKRVNKALLKLQEETAKRKANALAKHGGKKPPRKKRPSKSKKK